MEDEEFKRLEKVQFLINEGYEIPKEELDWIIYTIKRLDTTTNLMAANLVTPIHSKEWVLEYYKGEADKRLCGK